MRFAVLEGLEERSRTRSRPLETPSPRAVVSRKGFGRLGTTPPARRNRTAEPVTSPRLSTAARRQLG